MPEKGGTDDKYHTTVPILARPRADLAAITLHTVPR